MSAENKSFRVNKTKKVNKTIVRLAVSAMMLALAFILSLVKVWEMPFGGAVTLFSMLPLCFVGIKYGAAWGVGTAFCFSWLQIMQGQVFSWGLTPGMLVASIFLDYIIAFSVLGLAGIFRYKGRAGMIAGTAFVCVLRFVVHFFAGVVLWANYAEFVAFGTTWVDQPALYSLVYNGAYMLPETAITVVGIVLLSSVPQVRKLIQPE